MENYQTYGETMDLKQQFEAFIRGRRDFGFFEEAVEIWAHTDKHYDSHFDHTDHSDNGTHSDS